MFALALGRGFNKMKRLILTIFFSVLFCGQVFAAGNIIDRGASSAEVTAQERDDIWLSPASIPHIMSAPGTVSKFQLDHNVELLNADRTILITDKPIQRLDANGTDRNVLLPTEATSTDLVFFIYNMSGELGEDLNVQDDASADLETIHFHHFGICTCDGTTWVVRCISCTEGIDTLNLRVKEENTSAIVIGQPCYISGATGAAFANAGLADCDDSSKIRVKGLASEDISQNTTGYLRVKGLLESINSTKGSSVNPLSQDWAAGDQLWVSATAGGLTNVRPVGRSIKAGTALTVEGNNSKILVDIHENPAHTGAAASEDITFQMGDSAGANKVIYQNFAGTEVGSIDSNGERDFMGNYALQLQNIPDLVSKGEGYWFDGTDDVITVADDADIDFGTADDFYIEMEVMPLDVTRTTDYLVNKEAGGIGYGLYINQDDLYIRLDDNTHDVSAIIGTAVFSNYVRVHVLVSFDRSGDATAYINGKSVGTVDISSVTSTISSAGNLHIGQDSAGGNEFNGEICKGRIGNLTKTAAEVKALSSGAPVPYKYLGASQAEQTGSDPCSADLTANWTKIDCTLVFDTDHYELVYSANTQYIYRTAVHTTGKRYRLSMDIKDGTASDVSGVLFVGPDHTLGAKLVSISITTTSSWQTHSVEYTAISSTDTVAFYSELSADNIEIKNIKLVQIGCVLQLEQDGIGHNQWQDNSGNELHGTVSGALPINLPVNHQEKYIDLTVTGNGSFTLPMGHKIKSIIVKETAGNALTGGLDVGLSTNGVEVVSGMAVAGSATVLCTLVEAGTIGATFTTADDTIYFSDGDDDGNWTSAELELRVQMERLTLN